MALERICFAAALLTLGWLAWSAPALGASTVTVRANIPFVPGAIVCEDLETVQFIVGQFRSSFIESTQDTVTAGGTQLLRKTTQQPDLKSYGCEVVPAGTVLNLSRSFGMADEVSGKMPNGHIVSGVTIVYMVE